MDRRTAIALIGGMLAAACGPRPAPPSPMDELAERYVRVALQVAQHDPRLVDGWLGPDGWRPGPRVPVAGLVSEIEAVGGAVSALEVEGDAARRQRYLRGQLQALHLAGRRLLGDTFPLASEAARVYGWTPPPVDWELVRSAIDALDRRWPGSDPVGTRVQAFRRRLIVAPDRREAVARAALGVCRERTRAAIQLPAGEDVTLAMVSGMPWDGYCRYEGRGRSVIEVNSDGAPTVSRLLWLAAHEGYPGHHVQHVVIDRVLVEGLGWVEYALQPAFGPHLLVAEGAAELGVEIVLPDEHREHVYADVLLPEAGLPAALARDIVDLERLSIDVEPAIPEIVAAYLDGAASAGDSVERLARETLVADPRAFLSFAERQRTRLYAYPMGRWLAEAVVGAPMAPDAWARLFALYERGLVA
jgi:hypothetical protein